jgi:hypothetical protein
LGRGRRSFRWQQASVVWSVFVDLLEDLEHQITSKSRRNSFPRGIGRAEDRTHLNRSCSATATSEMELEPKKPGGALGSVRFIPPRPGSGRNPRGSAGIRSTGAAPILLSVRLIPVGIPPRLISPQTPSATPG